ncbi:MAG: helix-turn-helix domain-containing protein [Eubacteriales bacterium]
MNYIEIVTDAIQYIESNLHRKLCLEELASHYYLSPMHFHRIFRAVTNQTLKSYILGRKLSEAAIALKNTNGKVLDIAFRYGFNSHEQFTRDFLKMFHITPSRYRKDNIPVLLIDRIEIIERDFKNENKNIIVDYSCREIQEIRLLGREYTFNPWNPCELEGAIRKGSDFEEKYFDKGNARRLFHVMRTCSSDEPRISCFSGIAAEEYSGDRFNLEETIIPGSKYAVFRYPEIMGLIFPTVLKDLYRWYSVSEIKLNNNTGIDSFALQTEDYRQTGKFYLYVPVL